MKNIYKNLFSAALALSLALNLVPCGLTFADELPPGGVGGVSEVIDYSQNVDTSGYAHGFGGWSTEGSSVAVCENGTLAWTTSNYGATNTYAVMTIPLNKEIDPAKGEFSVTVTAKLPDKTGRRIRGFAILSGNANGTYNTSNDTLMGMAQTNDTDGYILEAGNTELWMNKQDDKTDFNAASNYNNIGSKSFSDAIFMTKADASGAFYTYRWDINPSNQTFRFYYQKEGDKTWTEPYGELYMMNTNTAVKNDRFEEAGLLPTGTLPQKIKSLKFRQYEYNANNKANAVTTYIKKIEVEQLTTPNVVSVKSGNVTLGEDLAEVEPNAQTDILFDTVIKPDSVTKENIFIVNEKTGEKISSDIYSLELSADYKTVSVVFKNGKALDYGEKYRLEISGIKAYTTFEGEMTQKEKISFSTLSKYEVKNLNANSGTADGGINFTFDLKDYVKENNGQKYTIVASLVEKETNTTYAVGAEFGTSVFEDKVLKTTPYTIKLLKPENFESGKFEIRLYIWTGFENSQGILKAEPLNL